MKPPPKFAQTVGDTHHEIRAYIARMGVLRADVDDIAQEVFIDYFKSLKRKPAQTEDIAWLKGIARNKCLSYFRKNKRNPASTPLDENVLHLSLATNDSDEKEFLRAALSACLDQLTPRARRLVTAKYMERKSGEELARTEGVKAGAARIALLRAREALRECIGREMKERHA